MITKNPYAAIHAFNGRLTDTESLAAKAKGLLGSVVQRFRDEAAARQAVWELEQLDDRALKDIGLNRFDIQAHVQSARKLAAAGNQGYR